MDTEVDKMKQMRIGLSPEDDMIIYGEIVEQTANGIVKIKPSKIYRQFTTTNPVVIFGFKLPSWFKEKIVEWKEISIEENYPSGFLVVQENEIIEQDEIIEEPKNADKPTKL